MSDSFVALFTGKDLPDNMKDDREWLLIVFSSIKKDMGNQVTFVTAKVWNKWGGGILCTIGSNSAKHFIKW